MSQRAASLASVATIAPVAISLLAALAACGESTSKPADSPVAAAPSASAAAVASGPAPAGSSAPQGPDAATLEAREVTAGLTKQTIATPDGIFSAEVEAAGKPELTKEGNAYVLRVPIGTRSPIECDVIPARIDTAGSLARRFIDIGKSVTIAQAKPTDVGAAGGAGVLFAEAAYGSDKEGQSLRGLVKVAARASDRASVICMHNEVGYRATFKRIALQIAAGPKAPATDVPSYVQVDAIKVNGVPVGFAELSVVEEKIGTKMLDTRTVMLGPKSQTELTGVDGLSKIRVDKTGVVVGGAFQKLHDGQIESDVTLNRAKGNEYKVKGKAEGGDVNASFKAARELTTEYGRAKTIAKFLAGKEQEAKFSEYDPDEDAKGSVEIVVQKKDGAVVVTRKDLIAKVAYDDAGLPKTVEVKVNNATLTSERVHTSGKP